MQTYNFKEWVAHGLKINIIIVSSQCHNHIPTILIGSCKHLFMQYKSHILLTSCLFMYLLCTVSSSSNVLWLSRMFSLKQDVKLFIRYIFLFQLNIHISKHAISIYLSVFRFSSKPATFACSSTNFVLVSSWANFVAFSCHFNRDNSFSMYASASFFTSCCSKIYEQDN